MNDVISMHILYKINKNYARKKLLNTFAQVIHRLNIKKNYILNRYNLVIHRKLAQ